MVLVTCNRKGLQPLLVVCFFFVFFLQRAAQEPFVIFVFEKNYLSINKALVIITYCVCILMPFSLESLGSNRILFLATSR